MIKYHSGRFELKAVDGEARTFEGYASVFGHVDSYRDVIEKGAFTKTLSEFGRRVKVLYQHDRMLPIGKPIEMEEDLKGLRVKAKVSETSVGKDVLILLGDGVVDELSIGYTPIKDTYDRDKDIRYLHEVKLWEFSPVTWAANDLATITGVKSYDDALAALDQSRAFYTKLAGHGPLSDALRTKAASLRDTIATMLKDFETLLAAEPGHHSAPGAVHPPTTEPDPFHSLRQLADDMKRFTTQGG